MHRSYELVIRAALHVVLGLDHRPTVTKSVLSMLIDGGAGGGLIVLIVLVRFNVFVFDLLDKVEHIFVHVDVGLLFQVESAENELFGVLQALLVASTVEEGAFVAQLRSLLAMIGTRRALVEIVPEGDHFKETLKSGHCGWRRRVGRRRRSFEFFVFVITSRRFDVDIGRRRRRR